MSTELSSSSLIFASAWESLYEHSSFGCVLMDGDGRMISVTRSFAEMIECQVEQLFGESIFEKFIFPDNLDSAKRLADGVTMRIATRCDGRSWRWSVHRIAAGNALAGYLIGLLCSENVFEASDRQLQHQDRLALLGSLTAEMTHEIASPLTIIANNAELLLFENKLNRESRQTLAVIRDEAHRLGSLLHDVLCFVHDVPLNIRAQDGIKVLEKTINLFSRQGDQRHVSLRIEAEKDLPPLAGDDVRLQQVFFNLIKNAYDASPDNSEILILVRRAENVNSDEAIEFVFINSGEGIDPSNLEHVFEPYFSTKSAGLGTGLGLPIARRIVMAHEGQLRLTSNPGEGTRAIVLLPVWSSATCHTEEIDEVLLPCAN